MPSGSPAFAEEMFAKFCVFSISSAARSGLVITCTSNTQLKSIGFVLHGSAYARLLTSQGSQCSGIPDAKTSGALAQRKGELNRKHIRRYSPCHYSQAWSCRDPRIVLPDSPMNISFHSLGFADKTAPLTK